MPEPERAPVGRGMLVVFSTVGSQEDAERIARTLVEERLAACVSIVPGLTSLYWWEGKISRDPEVLLIIKTSEQAYERLETRLREIHPYQVPEIVALRAERVYEGYMEWLEGEVR